MIFWGYNAVSKCKHVLKVTIYVFTTFVEVFWWNVSIQKITHFEFKTEAISMICLNRVLTVCTNALHLMLCFSHDVILLNRRRGSRINSISLLVHFQTELPMCHVSIYLWFFCLVNYQTRKYRIQPDGPIIVDSFRMHKNWLNVMNAVNLF